MNGEEQRLPIFPEGYGAGDFVSSMAERAVKVGSETLRWLARVNSETFSPPGSSGADLLRRLQNRSVMAEGRSWGSYAGEAVEVASTLFGLPVKNRQLMNVYRAGGQEMGPGRYHTTVSSAKEFGDEGKEVVKYTVDPSKIARVGTDDFYRGVESSRMRAKMMDEEAEYFMGHGDPAPEISKYLQKKGFGGYSIGEDVFILDPHVLRRLIQRDVVPPASVSRGLPDYLKVVK